MTLSPISDFKTSPQRVLFFSNDKLCVYHYVKGELESSYLFDITEEGKEYFEKYIRETPELTTCILVDYVKEEYREDTIPHVYGSDRNALIERKKSRFFRDTPYYYVDFLGRQTQGRKDDNVLFVGLTNPEDIRPWLQILENNMIPLVGIYSVPQVKNYLLEIIPASSKNILIVSMQSISGLRQTYFKNKKLIISRLIELPRYSTGSYAPVIKEEVEKIRRYLDNTHLQHGDEILDVYFLGTRELLEELKNLYVGIAAINTNYIDVNDLSGKTGLNRHLTTPFCDQILVKLLMEKRPKNRYAGKQEQRYFIMQNMKKIMFASSVILLLAGMIFSSMNILDRFNLERQAVMAENNRGYYLERYETARKRLPRTSVSPHELKILHDIVATLENHKSTPFNLISTISNGMDQIKDIQIDEIIWAASVDPNFKIQGSLVVNEDTAGVNETGIDQDENYSLYHIASIRGHLDSFDGNYRSAIQLIEQFSEILRKAESIHDVTITSLPLNFSPNTRLRGNTETVTDEAKFAIRIVMGVRHEA